MARALIILGVFVVCLVCVLHASPVPQEQPQTTASNDLDDIANRAKDIWNNARESVGKKVDEWMKNTDINDTLEKTKSFFNQAGDTIRKEAEKLGEKFKD